MSRTLSQISLSMALGLTLIACKGGDADGGAAAEKADAPAAPAKQVEPTPEPAKPAEGEEGAAADAGSESDTGEEEAPAAPLPATFDKIGVEECDDYVADHVACIEAKVPEAEREAARRSVFDNLETWKQTAAGGPSAEKGLSTACRIAREQAKRATQDLGCEW